jgi:hypothetical protein
VNSRPESNNAGRGLFAPKTTDRETLNEQDFQRMISIERRRTARSRKIFLLMLLEMGEHSSSKHNRPSLSKVLSTLSLVLRETDVTGWYKEGSVVGVMFTEITLDNDSSIPATMMNRVSRTLKSHLTPDEFHQIGISFHLLPETGDRGVSSQTPVPAVYPGVSVPRAAEASY